MNTFETWWSISMVDLTALVFASLSAKLETNENWNNHFCFCSILHQALSSWAGIKRKIAASKVVRAVKNKNGTRHASLPSKRSILIRARIRQCEMLIRKESLLMLEKIMNAHSLIYHFVCCCQMRPIAAILPKKVRRYCVVIFWRRKPVPLRPTLQIFWGARTSRK